MLKQRVISAIVLIALVLIALLWLSPFYFALVLSVVIALAVWEWTQFAQIKLFITRIIIAGITFAFLFLAVYGERNYLNVGRIFEAYVEPLLLLSVIWWTIALSFVIAYPNRH